MFDTETPGKSLIGKMSKTAMDFTSPGVKNSAARNPKDNF